MNFRHAAIVAGLAMLLTLAACGGDEPAKTDTNAEVDTTKDDASKATESEEGVAKAFYAAMKAKDAKAIVALFDKSEGTGGTFNKMIEERLRGGDEDEVKGFSKRFGVTVEQIESGSFEELSEVVVDFEILGQKNFDERIKTMGDYKKSEEKDEHGQWYIAELSNGGSVGVAVLKTKAGKFCIGHIDIDHWNGKVEGEKAIEHKEPIKTEKRVENKTVEEKTGD